MVNTRTVKSFCRICGGICAVDVTVENGRIAKVRGDRTDPLTRGFACAKGLKATEQHHGPKRLRSSLRKSTDGKHAPIASNLAIAEVADRLRAIIDRHGPNAVALYTGTQAFMNALGRPLARALLDAIGSINNYSTMTIDQSAKWLAHARIGSFAAGSHPFEESDVWLSIGTNPMVSLLGGPGLSGFAGQDPVKTLKEAKAERGMKLIVIDPRYSETARFADLFLQPRPGTDAALLAAILHVVLREGWHDAEFCQRHVQGIESLRSALAPFTPELIADVADVPAELIVDAARMFAKDGSVGRAGTGTGTDMGPRSNLAEHLAHTLNVVCGRFLRAGDKVLNPGVLHPVMPRHEEVIPPFREWEASPQGKVHGTGQIKGQMMTATLADEILSSGEDRIRALICVGGNPAIALPDEAKARKALQALELLITVDPQMTATARYSDYVIAPKVQYERTDHTGAIEFLLGVPYARYSDAVIEPEPDMDVVDEWRLFWDLARAMGLNLEIGETVFDTSQDVGEEDIIRAINPTPRIPLAEVRAVGSGRIYPLDQAILPARPEHEGHKVDLLPEDVADDIADLASSLESVGERAAGGLMLTVRRDREVINSFLTDFTATQQKRAIAPLYAHPRTIAELGLAEGDMVRVTSGVGSLVTCLVSDPDLRGDTVQMTHCWPGVDIGSEAGASTSILVDSERHLEAINRMPVMSGIPVTLEEVAVTSRPVGHTKVVT